MKSYHVHRSAQCPTGAHMVYDEATNTEVTQDCDCPALVVSASGPPGPVEPHLMQWSRGELARLVTEFDRGYFDPDGMPPRRSTQFLSAFQSEILDMIARSPLSAMVTLLSRAAFDQITLDTGAAFTDASGRTYPVARPVLSLRMMPGHWARIWLPVDGGDELFFEEGGCAGGNNPVVLWERPLSDREKELTEADIRGRVRDLMGAQAWEPYTRGEAQETAAPRLVDDGHALTERVLADLADAAAQLAAADTPLTPLKVEPASSNGTGRRRGGGSAKGASGAKKRLPPAGR